MYKECSDCGKPILTEADPFYYQHRNDGDYYSCGCKIKEKILNAKEKILNAIDFEPELDGPMPEKMKEALKNADWKTVEKLLIITVQTTKQEISKRIKKLTI